ncbi:hypothetical protein [Candidatus Electronema sp. PJ]|uniref:hypothetical protein n=1 Tax=Candidatus Electronema sp. PJ TaxID=3401572 RepID=UPI003AA85F2A
METYLTIVDVSIGGELKKNAFALKVPTWQPVPLPGDLIQVPESAAKQENIPMVLKVLSRRFIFDDLILDRLSRDCQSCIILLTEPPS